jgi:8-oxo-dGTP pyrophosphatase MutT (NUDIX family)
LYDKYLQPGGHIESFDASILAAALREASEETGILQQELLYTKYNPSKNFPLDIDSHPIPPNKARDEPAHIHHDLRYLFIYKGNQEIKAPPAEAKAAQWISVAELQKQKMFATVAKKITTIANRL